MHGWKSLWIQYTLRANLQLNLVSVCASWKPVVYLIKLGIIMLVKAKHRKLMSASVLVTQCTTHCLESNTWPAFTTGNELVLKGCLCDSSTPVDILNMCWGFAWPLTSLLWDDVNSNCITCTIYNSTCTVSSLQASGLTITVCPKLGVGFKSCAHCEFGKAD